MQISSSSMEWWNAGRNITDKLSGQSITVLVTILTVLFWFKKSRKLIAPLPPGPRGLPVVGYLPFLGPVTSLHRTFRALAAVHGPIYKLWVGPKLCVVINSPSLVKEMIHDHDAILTTRGPSIAATTVLNEGADIFTSNGQQWRNMRKIFSSKMLSNVNLDACYDMRRKEVRKAICDVYSRKIGTLIDIDQLTFVTVSYAVISMVMGGGGENWMDGILPELRNVLEEINFAATEWFDMWPLLAWFDKQGIEKKAKKVSSRYDRIFDPLIEQRMKQKVASEGIEDENTKKDFLQILLELKDNGDGDDDPTSFTMIQLKALLKDAIVGGIDAPGTAAKWVMAELMQHQDVMEKVKEELTEVVGLNNIVEEFHVPNLHYLDAVIKETLRLHPPVPLLIPRAPNEFIILGGYSIPKGTQVYLNAWSIHRDPLFWDNPSEFRPERFLNDQCKIDYLGYNVQYFPFGSGRRMCAGLPLAKRMLPYILASFLHSFEWKLPHGVEEVDLSDSYEFLLKSKTPLVAVPTPRLSKSELYL